MRLDPVALYPLRRVLDAVLSSELTCWVEGDEAARDTFFTALASLLSGPEASGVSAIDGIVQYIRDGRSVGIVRIDLPPEQGQSIGAAVHSAILERVMESRSADVDASTMATTPSSTHDHFIPLWRGLRHDGLLPELLIAIVDDVRGSDVDTTTQLLALAEFSEESEQFGLLVGSAPLLALPDSQRLARLASKFALTIRLQGALSVPEGRST